MENYSVLMSVYFKENPTYLKQAMESIYNQTLPTNDFVLVCDGPLTENLNSVISEMKILFSDRLNIVRLKENGGLGNALNEGMKHCKNEIIARMDSDDISYPTRCDKELKILIEKDVDILSAGIEEFTDDIDIIEAKRIPPESHKEIIEFAKKRNPFNHPCVMYKKSAVEKAGGYQDFYLLEDYYLWIRMLLNGAKTYNIQECLLWMRAGSDMYKRRSGIKYMKSQTKLFKYMKNNNYISNFDFIKSSLIRILSSLAPNFVREKMFKKFNRKR